MCCGLTSAARSCCRPACTTCGCRTERWGTKRRGTWRSSRAATTNLRVTPEPSKLTVTSPEAAEVWVDGTKVGDTPLNAAPVPLGTHDVLVKRASGGERRYTITVGVKPFTLNADFR